MVAVVVAGVKALRQDLYTTRLMRVVEVVAALFCKGRPPESRSVPTVWVSAVVGLLRVPAGQVTTVGPPLHLASPLLEGEGVVATGPTAAQVPAAAARVATFVLRSNPPTTRPGVVVLALVVLVATRVLRRRLVAVLVAVAWAEREAAQSTETVPGVVAVSSATSLPTQVVSTELAVEAVQVTSAPRVTVVAALLLVVVTDPDTVTVPTLRVDTQLVPVATRIAAVVVAATVAGVVPAWSFFVTGLPDEQDHNHLRPSQHAAHHG